jgi:hypothetical protein
LPAPLAEGRTLAECGDAAAPAAPRSAIARGQRPQFSDLSIERRHLILKLLALIKQVHEHAAAAINLAQQLVHAQSGQRAGPAATRRSFSSPGHDPALLLSSRVSIELLRQFADITITTSVIGSKAQDTAKISFACQANQRAFISPDSW